MHRRAFLSGLTLLAALPLAARAQEKLLTIGIYPGTGKADIPTYEFVDAAKPFAQALAAPLGLEPRLVLFRSIKNTLRSLDKGSLDIYFVPPTVAVSVLDRNYTPVARVRDEATGILIRRKGVEISAVALTEKESWLDVMARYTLKRKKPDAEVFNLKTQEDIALALERDIAQAGSLRSALANKLIAQGKYEVWHPLPNTPDFTLMVSNKLSPADQDKLGTAAASLKPEIVQSLQRTIHSKVTGFVVDKQADYKIIKEALKEAGYLE